MDIKTFVTAFVNNQLGKKTICGNYKVVDNRLVWEGHRRNYDYRTGSYLRNEEFGQDLIAMKLPTGQIIGNAGRLNRLSSWRNGVVTEPQRILIELQTPMLPLSVFLDNKLDLNTLAIINTTGEEKIKVAKTEWKEGDQEYKPLQVRFSTKLSEDPKGNKDFKIISCEKKENQQVSQIYKTGSDKGSFKRDKTGHIIRKLETVWNTVYYDKRNIEERHFIGAMLLSVGGKQYLFDIDRREVKFFRMNPFLVELPKTAKTVAGAYKVLMPDRVKKAIKAGKKVLRQGEWYFIPTKEKVDTAIKLPENLKKLQDDRPNESEYDLENWADCDRYDPEPNLKKELLQDNAFKRLKPKYRTMVLSRLSDFNKEIVIYAKGLKQIEAWKKENQYFEYGGDLQVNDNRPNSVDLMVKIKGETYVKGKVSHEGREHEDLELKSWHIPVPNGATNSFTITGDVD